MGFQDLDRRTGEGPAALPVTLPPAGVLDDPTDRRLDRPTVLGRHEVGSARRAWTHPEKPVEAFDRAERECLAEANEAAGDDSETWGVVEPFYEDCLEERGWTRTGG